MRKKYLMVLLSIVTCLMLVGCGKENSLDSNLGKESNSNQTNETINNASDNIIMDDDEIIDFDDDDNEPIVEETVNVNEVINCPGCVYAYFSKEGEEAKRLGSTLSSDEYTTDIRKLKTNGGTQRHNFFGLVLSDNTISRAYSCILKDNKIYCIEGSTNGEYHSSNISVLNKIFTSNQCQSISDGHTYWCTDGSYNGDTQTSGYASMHYETSCTIYGANAKTGQLICH